MSAKEFIIRHRAKAMDSWLIKRVTRIRNLFTTESIFRERVLKTIGN